MDVARIEERIDRVAAGALEVSDQLGGLRFQNMIEVMEFSKLMSVAGLAVPPHLRGEPGTCLAVCVQALEWRFSPFAVANKSYSVNGRIAYESQLIHAVIEARAPLVHRLKCEYEGAGETRVCIVTGLLKNEVEPIAYRSPEFSKITPKNSPLWKTDPDQQLWYYASRAWARRFCPDVLLGVYSKDELQDSHIGADNARDVTPKPSVADRLKGNKGRGFSASHVERETGHGEKTDPATGEVTNSQATTGGANEVANTAKDQTRLADASETENRSAAAQEGGKAGEKPAAESQAKAGSGSETKEGPGQPESDASASRLPDGRTSGAVQPEPGTNGGASNAGAQDGDSSERVTSGGGENRPQQQPDLLSDAPAGSKGQPNPHGQTEGADDSRGEKPSAPDRLRSYSKALLSITDAPAKLVKQSDAWIRKYEAFQGDDERKRVKICAVHLNRLTGTISIDACKKQVEEIISK
jgi:RecT family